MPGIDRLPVNADAQIEDREQSLIPPLRERLRPDATARQADCADQQHAEQQVRYEPPAAQGQKHLRHQA
jgi:hypothetical protein